MPTFEAIPSAAPVPHSSPTPARSHRADFAPSYRARIEAAASEGEVVMLLGQASACRTMAPHTLARCRRAAAQRIAQLTPAKPAR